MDIINTNCKWPFTFDFSLSSKLFVQNSNQSLFSNNLTFKCKDLSDFDQLLFYDEDVQNFRTEKSLKVQK